MAVNLIYSIVPYEVIMSAGQDAGAEWIRRDGRFFEVTRQGNCRTISRMMSTDPKDYLNPGYNPGEVLR